MICSTNLLASLFFFIGLVAVNASPISSSPHEIRTDPDIAKIGTLLGYFIPLDPGAIASLKGMLAGKQKHIMKAPTIEETELAKEAASGESLVQHQYEVVFQQPNADKLRPSMSIVVMFYCTNMEPVEKAPKYTMPENELLSLGRNLNVISFGRLIQRKGKASEYPSATTIIHSPEPGAGERILLPPYYISDQVMGLSIVIMTSDEFKRTKAEHKPADWSKLNIAKLG